MEANAKKQKYRSFGRQSTGHRARQSYNCSEIASADMIAEPLILQSALDSQV